MKLSEKKGGDFTPHPETEGTVKAVIVDITPLKTVPDKFNPGNDKQVFRLVFETEVVDDDGKRFCIWSKPYTPSLNPKANFRKDVKKVMGRDLTQAELDEFETEGLLHTPVQMIIQHEQGEDGKTYAVISFLGPDKSDKPLKPSGKYTRAKDREEKAGGTASGDQAGYRKAPAASEDEGRQPWQKCKVHVGKHAGVDLGDLDEDGVKALLEKWLPVHQANAKPKADDKRLAAALAEVAELLGGGAEAEAEPDY